LSACLLLCALVVAASLRGAKRRELELRSAESRRGIYQSVTLAWGGALRSGGNRPTELLTWLPKDIAGLEGRLALRASPKVLRDYSRLRQLASQADTPLQKVREQFLSLVLEMRCELGMNGWRLAEREALERLFLNDAGPVCCAVISKATAKAMESHLDI
jgi:hypothetical protein